jgi:hypothetical protein
MKKVMCAKCGGKVKMAKGGTAKPFIAGIPNGGPTGPNYQGIDTMKKGGLVKKQNGGKTGAQLKAEGMTMKAKGLRAKEQGNRMKVEGMALKELGQDMKKVGQGQKRMAAQEKAYGKYYNPTGRKSYAKGGLIKKQDGGAKDEPIYTMGPRKVKKNLRGNFVVKEKGMEFDPRTNEMATVKTRRVIPKNIKPGDVRKDVIRKKTIVTKDALDNLKKGGSTFGMLSVKAGIDKNPKPTAADRIAGAKMNKKKVGGVIRKKK